MEFIPAGERYSLHANSLDVPLKAVGAALIGYGFPAGPRITKLSGGFQNANFLAEADDQKAVVRFYSTGADVSDREVGILQNLVQHEVRAPKVLDSFLLDDRPVVILEFLPGEMLQQECANADYRSVGFELGKIDSLKFEHPGFLGAEMKPGTQFINFSVFVRKFMQRVFPTISEQKLNPETRERLLKLISDKWHLVEAMEPLSQLTHCDFNPKNILVSEGKVSAVLDWEFSLAGNGIVDIGNFFRFSYDYPAHAVEDFAAGYREAGGVWRSDWRDVSLLMDLGNMCGFLERHEDYPKTFHTARAVIEATLKHFGY